MFKVPVRTLRDAYQRISGSGNKVKGAVRTVFRSIEKRSKLAYDAWKNYVNSCERGELLDGIKSQKLKIALREVSKRTIRDSFQRIFGSGNRIKGAVKDVIRKIEKRVQVAFSL